MTAGAAEVTAAALDAPAAVTRVPTPVEASSYAISTVPPGALVYVNGQPTGSVTPVSLELVEGARLRLEAAGFQPVELRHSLTNQRELRFELEPLPLASKPGRAPSVVPYPRKRTDYAPVVPAGDLPASSFVILTLVIDTDGNVVDVEVLRGAGSQLDAAAIDAAWRWRFEPTLRDGNPVPVIGNFSVPFGTS